MRTSRPLFRQRATCRSSRGSGAGPPNQVLESSVKWNFRFPAELLLRFGNVADVVLLVAFAPVGEGVSRLFAGEGADAFDDLQQVALVLRPAAHVVDLAF